MICAGSWLVPKQPLVCDTTVLLYLGRISQADLLPVLFTPIYVPEAVMLELNMGRLLRPDTFNPQDCAWATSVVVPQDAVDVLPPNRLGTGERAVIAHAHVHQGCIAGLDDLQARRLAEGLGLAVVGTPGVLLRAKRASLISTVRPLLDALNAQGFRLEPNLYQGVLNLAGEA
jgi:predicted nucleic acid-binding protein